VEAKRPNIVFFLIDDLGWADVGCFGSNMCVDYIANIVPA
jgi:arylsulfatase A-like enzyme